MAATLGIGLAVVGLVLAIVGLADLHATDPLFADPVHLLFLDWLTFRSPTDLILPGAEPRALAWAPKLLALAALGGLLAGAVKVFGSVAEEWLAGRSAGHLIVVGPPAATAALAHHRASRDRRIVRISSTRPRTKADRGGSLLVVGDDAEPSTLRRAGALRASTLLIATGADARNLAVLGAVRELLEAGPEPRSVRDPLQCLVEIREEPLRAELTQARSTRQRAPLGVSFFAPQVEAASRVLLEYPAHRFADVEGPNPVKLLVLGWSRAAEQIVVRAVQQVQYGRQGPSITVFDVAHQEAERAFRERYPGFDDVASIEFTPIDPSLPREALERGIAAGWLDGVCAAYLCFEDGRSSLSVMRALGAALGRADRVVPALFAWAEEGKGWLTDVDDEVLGAHIGWRVRFGAQPEVDPILMRFEGTVETVARYIHAQYQRRQAELASVQGKALPYSEPWADLPEVARDSNRAQALTYGVKEYLLRLKRVHRRIAPTDVVLDPHDVEVAARGEHSRWTAEKVSHGYRHGARRDEATKQHPSMAHFDQLPEAEQQKDRDAVRDVPEGLRHARVSVLRRKAIALVVLRDDLAAASRDVENALAQLRRRDDRASHVLVIPWVEPLRTAWARSNPKAGPPEWIVVRDGFGRGSDPDATARARVVSRAERLFVPSEQSAGARPASAEPAWFETLGAVLGRCADELWWAAPDPSDPRIAAVSSGWTGARARAGRTEAGAFVRIGARG